MIEQALMEYIANALWQIPLLAGGAWILLWMVRLSVRAQHLLWLMVLGLAVLLPMHGMGAAAVTVTKAQNMTAGPQMQTLERTEETAPSYLSARFGERDGLRLQWTPRLHSVHLAAAAVYWIVTLYVSAILLGVFRIARAWRAAQRLVEESREIALCYQGTVCLEDYGRRLRIRLPQIRESEAVKSPMIVGVVEPVLLLPVGFGRFTKDEVKAVLCHELAHVKRRDYLVNLICQMIALPVVWHPVTHGVQRRIRRTREMVCDAMAAREMESEMGYAKCLLALARGMLGSGPEQAEAMGLFGNDVLEERVMRLMETKTVTGVEAKVVRVASGAAVMMIATALAATFHVVPTMAAVQTAALPGMTQSVPEVGQASPEVTQQEITVAPPVPVQSDEVQPAPKEQTSVHRSKSEAERSRVVGGEKWEKLTPEQRRDAEKTIAEAEAQVKKAEAHFNSPEFKKQMEDVQRQAAEAAAKMNSPEFRQRMAEAQRKVAEVHFNSPEFKKQMEDVQRQAAETAAKMNSPEFRQKMAEAQRKVAEAHFNSPEFKKQMEDVQRQAAEAAAKVNSPEFREQMAEVQRKVAEAHFNSPEFKKQMEDVQRQAAEAAAKVNSPEFREQMENLNKNLNVEIERSMKDAMKNLNDAQTQSADEQKKVK